jgi:acyl-CoA dehydrogenase
VWDFETEPEYQAQLDWVRTFVEEEVDPLEHVVADPFDLTDPLRNELIRPLQEEVRRRRLWACHLGPELDGEGYGQVKLALLNELIGHAACAPVVFGAQAPDSGNAEILAHYGTPAQKERWLAPLLRNDVVSAFSMTEPQGGADPGVFTTTAVPDGDGWVLSGEKWFITNARHAAFLIVLAVTDPTAPVHLRQSMFLVPADAPGVEIIRNSGVGPHVHDGTHAYLRYDHVRLPGDALLGERGGGFVVAQTRLGGGRIHHAMRAVATGRRCLEMMAERALSRTTQGEPLARKQLVQQMVAESWTELESFRLLVLRTAWRIDRLQDYRAVRGDIAAVKAAMPRVLQNVATRALQVHGSLGVSNEMPFVDYVLRALQLGLADGPTEVHQVTLARQVLAQHDASTSLFPRQHLPTLREAALTKYADVLARHR